MLEFGEYVIFCPLQFKPLKVAGQTWTTQKISDQSVPDYNRFRSIIKRTEKAMKKILSTICGCIFSASLFSATASAGTYAGIHPLQSDRFSFAIAGYFPEIDGAVWGDHDLTNEGTEIDMQGDVGMDDSDTLPAFMARWRFFEKSILQFEYFDINSAGGKTIGKTIEWEDLEFQVGAKVNGNLEMGVLRAFYGYSFIKDDKKEFGAGIGLHHLDVDISFRGDALINDTPVLSAERGIDEWAILPNIGAYGNYAFSDKWIVTGRVDWISAAIDKYEGGLWNVEGAIQYQAFRNFGVGAAYRYVALDIEVDEDDGDWGADVDFSGPMIFFTANF